MPISYNWKGRLTALLALSESMCEESVHKDRAHEEVNIDNIGQKEKKEKKGERVYLDDRRQRVRVRRCT